MAKDPVKTVPDSEEGEPPILGSWPRLYAMVLVIHAVLIACYYAISQWYS
jgi:hypothetical protein